MGIFRANKDKKDLTTSMNGLMDPFEALDDSFTGKNLFAEFSDLSSGPASGSAPSSLTRKKSSSRASDVTAPGATRAGRSWRTRAMIFALIAVTGFAVARTKIWSYFAKDELVYAYFEVRALDANGRPIAGAVVKNAGKRVGTTDSFGEWRRYMRVPLGATVPVTIAKKTSKELLFATKNFAVPPVKPEKSEVELRGSVQLLVADQGNSLANTAVQVSPNDMMRSGAAGEGGNQETMTLSSAKAPQSDEMKNQNQNQIQNQNQNQATSNAPASAAVTAAVPEASINELMANFVSSHERIWFESTGSVSSPLTKEVLPALIQRARDLGLHVDPNAAWKVRLTSLLDKPGKMDKEGGGLILVSSFDGEQGGAARDVLRNYQADPGVTARGILFALAHHVNKNVAIARKSGRWVAMLPATSSTLWRLAPGMIVAGTGSVFALSDEAFTEGKMTGYYLRPSVNEPCLANTRRCDLKTRSFAEVAPVPTWSRMRLQYNAVGKDPVKIFVSGYEAKLVGDKVYEFWGQPKARANATVVQGGRVVARSQIVGDVNKAAHLGVVTISHR